MCSNLIHFWLMLPILYPYNLWFSGDFTGRKMRALAKNRLNIKAQEKATHQTPY